MHITHILLLITLILALNKPWCSRAVSFLAAVTLGVATIENIIDLCGLSWMLIFGSLAYYHFCWSNELKTKNILSDHATAIKWTDITVATAFNLLIYLFIKHKLPGFHNLLTPLNATSVAHLPVLPLPATLPTPFYINFDKVMMAIIIVVFSRQSLHLTYKLEWRRLLKMLAIFLVCLGLLLFVLLVFQVDRHLLLSKDTALSFMPFWLVHNLFFVCCSEEIVFRGYVQNYLSKILARLPHWRAAVAIALSSIYFGLCHASMGSQLLYLSTLCGLFYGYCYYKTQNILCSILLHFLVNTGSVLVAAFS